MRSALAWWRGCGWLADDPTADWARPKIPVDTTRGLTRDQVAALWRLDVPLRDKTLWRLLYETAARAEEILGLDVGDLELPGKRARVISKGGMTEWVHWQAGAALLLPRLPGSRRRGPVFLASRKPARAVATADLCPVTGRARLSYRRAAELFGQSTRRLAHPEATSAELAGLRGWNLHQLRHSMLTRKFRERHQHAHPARPLPGTPPSAPSSATPAPAPKPSPATSPPPTLPHGAARHLGNQQGRARPIAGSCRELRQAVTGGPAQARPGVRRCLRPSQSQMRHPAHKTLARRDSSATG